MRKSVRYAWMIAATVAALCVLLAVLIVAIALGFERERLRSVIESALGRVVEAEVSIGALEGRLLPGLAVRDLRVGPADAPWIEVKRMSWRIRGFDLFERRIDIGPLRLTGVRVHLEGRGVERAGTAPHAVPSADAPALRLSVRGAKLEDAELEWIWSDACAGPCRIRARGRGEIRHLVWPMSREGLGTLAAEMAVDFEGALPGHVESEPLLLAGRMQARFEHDALHIATLELRTGDRNVTLEEEAQIVFARDRLGIERLDLRSEETSVRLRGGLQSDGFEGLALEIRGLEAEQLAQLAQIPHELAGRVDADLQLDGTFSRPRVRGDVRWEDAQIREMHLDRILATLRAAEPSVELSVRAVQGQRELLNADVTLPYEGALAGEFASLPEATARVRSESFEVAILAPLLPEGLRSLSGVARADLSWRGGAVPSLTGWVELDAGRIELPQIAGPLAPLRARAAFGPALDGVQVESFSLETPLGRVEGSGVLAESALRETQLRFAAVDVGALAKRLGAIHELGGTARAELVLDGPLERLSAQGFATWSRPSIGAAEAERIALEIELDATRLRGTARIQQSGHQRLMLRADLPRPPVPEIAALLGTGAEIHVVGDRFELAPWMALLPTSVVPPELRSLGGLAQMDLLWRGGAAPTLEGAFEIDTGRIELPGIGDALTPFRARAELGAVAGGVAVESFAMETPLAGARGRGIYAGGTLRGVQLDLDGIDVGSLATRLGVSEIVGGEGVAELSIEGPAERPSVRGAVRWLEPRVGMARAERVVLDIEADAARVRGTARVQGNGVDALLLNANLPRPVDGALATWLGPEASIDLTGESFDLAALAPLLPRQLSELRGRADLRLRLEGSEATPHLAGELRVSEGALTVPLLGQTFAPIEGRVQFASRQLVPDLLIGPPEARAVLTGSIEFDGLAPASGDLGLVLSHFALARSRLLQLDVTGTLRLTGPVRALALLGALQLESAQIRVPEPEDPILREILIATRPGTETPLVESAAAEPSALDYATMELDLLLPRNTWVRGRGIELELEGDLDLEKASLGPVRYVGTVSAVRGRYAFLGKRFDVRRGAATFEGTERLDPLIDVEAVHRVRDVDILAYLTGHLSNPILRLSSEPEYEESDVLALLLVGRRADELTEASGNFDTAATSLAAGIAANELSSVLQDYTPLDSLDVRIGEDGVPEEVGVGKYVWQDLFVRYGRTFGIEQKDKIGIEYRIDENWSIESEMVTDRSAGADLVWSVDF
jgi:autotransporter translocation and assembly factor TamB